MKKSCVDKGFLQELVPNNEGKLCVHVEGYIDSRGCINW